METIHLPVYFIYKVATFSDFCHPESGSEHSHCIIPTEWLSPVGQEPCVTGWETGPCNSSGPTGGGVRRQYCQL